MFKEMETWSSKGIHSLGLKLNRTVNIDCIYYLQIIRIITIFK